MAEKVDIFMPVFIGDYLGDTTDLTTEEHGAYLLILMAMWRAGGTLPDLRRLPIIAKVDAARWPAMWEVLGRFFDVDGNRVTQHRLVKELEIAQGNKASAVDRARAGGLAKAAKAKAQMDLELPSASSSAQAVLEVCSSPSPSRDPDPPPSHLSLVAPDRARSEPHADLAPPRPPRRVMQVAAATKLFLSVFERYPNGNGKQRAAQVWQELAESHPGGEEALAREIGARFDAGILARHPYSGEPKYRPTFETFLAERRWEDPDSKPDEPTGPRYAKL